MSNATNWTSRLEPVLTWMVLIAAMATSGWVILMVLRVMLDWLLILALMQ